MLIKMYLRIFFLWQNILKILNISFSSVQGLRPQIIERLLSALPTICSVTVHCHTLWILGEYASTTGKTALTFMLHVSLLTDHESFQNCSPWYIILLMVVPNLWWSIQDFMNDACRGSSVSSDALAIEGRVDGQHLDNIRPLDNRKKMASFRRDFQVLPTRPPPPFVSDH